jgi:acyl-CoA reductase-like NAD-dependent aldehyde dehydrogenase
MHPARRDRCDDAFNHPLLIAARGIAPALAAGNTVVIKPSETTPLTTLLLAELVHTRRAGVPPSALNVVIGLGPEAGAALASHWQVNRIEFTGATETGRAVAAAAGRNFGKTTVELGCKTPVLVFDDAALEDAAAGAAFGGFIAAGQTCVAGSCVTVHRAVAPEHAFATGAGSDFDFVCLVIGGHVTKQPPHPRRMSPLRIVSVVINASQLMANDTNLRQTADDIN